jgi:hypothetical protein
MVKKWVLILTIMLLILLPWCFSSLVVDATPAIGSTTVTLYSTVDAYVNSSSPETNYGNVDSMYVSANSEQDFPYVMFDLSSIPLEANIISAKLKIYLSSTGGEIYWYPADKIGAYYCSNNSWTEHEITWNNKPSFSSQPTDAWSFGIVYTVEVYKSWDITADVRAALPSGILTDVLKFETKTGDGYAVFQSSEDTNKPKLEVEYSMEPVLAVHLESIQDTGFTNNLGLTTFADYIFPLPTDIDIVTGTYQVKYSGGYMFTRWETSGGVTVSDEEAATTNVTVSGNGTLRAVGNVKRLEYTYDCEDPSGEYQVAGRIDAVRFTPLFSGQLLMARFYMYDISSYQSNTFKVHVMDDNRDDIITPFEQTPTSEGWFDLDLSSYGVSVNEGVDFYIGMEWITDYNPDLGEDRTSPSDRSWHWNGTHWQEETYSDFMLRAVVGTLIDHVIVADGTVFHVTTESNSTISNFTFIKEEKKLLFNVTGATGKTGYCNISIPEELLWGEFSIFMDGSLLIKDVDYTQTHNGTHYTFYISYSHSTHTINITGTEVIPEFPSPIFSLFFVTATLLAVILHRRKHSFQ